MIRDLMIQLDMALTGKARHVAEHTASGQGFDPVEHRIYYLSDGGYSRVVVNDDCQLSLTSSSLDRVKQAWSQPDVQTLIAAISNALAEQWSIK